MNNTVKLIIEIPKEAKQAFDIANDLKGGYYDHGGVIGKAIQNGIPLDDVKQEIWVTDFDFGDYYDHTAEIQDKVCGILDNIGKAESEEKPNDHNKV